VGSCVHCNEHLSGKCLDQLSDYHLLKMWIGADRMQWRSLCVHCDKHLSRKYLDQLSDYQLMKKMLICADRM
jgi:hypothetical protein